MPIELLKIDNLGYAYPGATVPTLSGIVFTLRPGECICLTGNSGCGKTTLLMAIKGLLRNGALTGSIEINAPLNREFSMTAGIVFQNPESQILCTTVAEEVAFGPENLCVPVADIGRRVRKALADVELGDCEGRSVERFSAGQKQRLAIASVLSMEPSLLLLDEPSSQLDRQGKVRLAGLLAGLKRQGYALLLAEHDPRHFDDVIDRYLTIDGGRIVSEGDGNLPPVPVGAHRQSLGGAAAAAVTVENLRLVYPETGEALKGVNLKVLCGERLHLIGRNGAGKSTLLGCLAGLERPDAGTVQLAEIGSPRPELLPGKVGVLFQNPVRQLFAESVFEEVAFTLRRMGKSHAEIEVRVAEALDICGILHLSGRAPLSLSFGEQHRVALASVLAPRPALYLLDEPFAGLDFPQRFSLLAILAELPARYGATVVIASHDELPDPTWADRTLFLDGGILVQDAV